MDADDFRDTMLSVLFLRYLSDNYETAAKKELGRDYPEVGVDARKVPLALWYENNADDIPKFQKQMRRKAHYVVQPAHLWNSIATLARTQKGVTAEHASSGYLRGRGIAPRISGSEDGVVASAGGRAAAFLCTSH
jgi:type I restriction enzyme M protein